MCTYSKCEYENCGVKSWSTHIYDMCIINLIIGPNKSSRRRRRFLCFIRENVAIPEKCLKKTFDARYFQFTIERIEIDMNRVRECSGWHEQH